MPSLSWIWVWDRGVKRDEITVDMELQLDAKFNLRATSLSFINAGLERIYFRSKIRIILGSLITERPTIGTLSLTFLEMPQVEWNFTGILRFLNIHFLQSLVSLSLASMYKNPNRIFINIAKYEDGKHAKLLREPLGLIRVELIKGSNLPNSILGPNTQKPYCPNQCAPTSSASRSVKPSSYVVVVVQEEEQRTHTVFTNSDPEWDQSFNFFHYDEENSQVQFFVYNDSKEEGENTLGISTIPIINYMVADSPLNGREDSITVRNPETGAIINAETGLTFRINLTSEVEQMNESARFSVNHLPIGSLAVFVDHVVGVSTSHSSVRAPEIRPMVRVSVGNQTSVTSILERTGSPIYEDLLNLLIYNPQLEDISAAQRA